MSAFYDIWIGSKRPEYKRLRNKPWVKRESAWLSMPEVDNGFLQQEVSRDYTITIIGQLYEVITIEDVLNRCIAYIEQGKEFIDPAGHYILFVQNKLTSETHVFTNRLGSYHAYWSNEGVISTYYLGQSKSSDRKQLNWDGITGFMAMGYFPNDTTYINGISIFEPSSYYRFDESVNLKERKRYRNWYYEPEQDSTGAYMEQLQSILQNSLRAATRDKRVALPISGGLDSRLLAGVLTDTEMYYSDLKGLSYGFTENSPEINIAEKVAAKRGIPLYSYVMPDYLFDELEEVADAVELFQYIDGTRQASARTWLSTQSDVVVGGHWGDVWMDNMNVATEEELQTAFQKKIIKRGSAWLLKNICEPNKNDTDDYLNDYFVSFMNQHADIKDADFKMKIYKTDQWSFRWTAASLRMYQSASMPVLPFYDKRIVDLFCKIPTDVVKNREMEISYIKQYHEDLAKISWQEYDADLYNYKYFNNRNIAYRAFKKAQRTLLGEKAVQRNWEVFYLNPEGKKNLERHLLGNKHLNGLLPELKIKQLLDDLHKNPTAANGYTVSMLLTFTLFLNKVFD